MGKGRKERCLPLWKQTAADLRSWLAVRGEVPTPELFINARGEPMTRKGFTYLLDKYAQLAMENCLSLKGKNISPHVLRHSCAMMLYQATGDLRKVSLWLGHAQMQTTEVYLRADPTEKIDAIDKVIPPTLKRGQFNVPGKLIAALQEKHYLISKMLQPTEARHLSGVRWQWRPRGDVSEAYRAGSDG